MDNTQLKSIATGIISVGHFPAHLGLTTDAEKIEWLARQVEAMVDDADSVERLEDEVEKLTDKVGELTDELGELEEIGACSSCDLCDVHK